MEETFTTPAGKVLVIKKLVTARMRNEIRNISLRDGKNAHPTGELLEEVEKKTVDLAVISYDGSTENIANRLLDATPEEYDFVVEKAASVVQGTLTSAK